MVKYVALLLVAAAVLLYWSFGKKDGPNSSTIKAAAENLSDEHRDPKELLPSHTIKQAPSIQTKREEAVQTDEADTAENADGQSMETESADAETPKKKRKLVGGAEVEWIEPTEPSEEETKFGRPPM